MTNREFYASMTLDDVSKIWKDSKSSKTFDAFLKQKHAWTPKYNIGDIVVVDYDSYLIVKVHHDADSYLMVDIDGNSFHDIICCILRDNLEVDDFRDTYEYKESLIDHKIGSLDPNFANAIRDVMA